MLALLLMMAAGATTFVAQDLPGLGIQGDDPDTMDRYWKFRKADIDGDGSLDILLPASVVFLKDGRFSTATPYPVKPGEPRPTADLWQGELYLRYPDRLEIHTWEEGRWRQRHAQPVPWPDPDPSFPTPDPDEQEKQPEPPGIRLTRFLHDIDGDGAPEIGLASRDGIHVYRKKDEAYTAAGTLKVYPPMRSNGLVLDPRGYSGNTPTRGMHCTVTLSDSKLVVTEPERMENYDVRYNVHRYVVRLGEDGAVADPVEESVLGPISPRMFATRLNTDDTVDFQGFEQVMSDSSAAPVPIILGRFSTDGGKSVQTVRTTATENGIVPLDADGDGDDDLFVLRQRMFEGGTREIVTRALTDRWVDHDLSVYLQDAQGRFATEPALRWRGRIELDAPPWRGSPFFMRYVDGELLNFTGDFNGDGRLDILTQDRPERIAVYLATGDTFQSEPEAMLPMSPEALFGASDIDSDGRSDVILENYPKPGQTRVYFSREGKP